MHSQARRKFWIIAGLLAPGLAIYTLFMIYPLVGTFVTTFFQTDGKRAGFLGSRQLPQAVLRAALLRQLLNALRNNF